MLIIKVKFNLTCPNDEWFDKVIVDNPKPKCYEGFPFQTYDSHSFNKKYKQDNIMTISR